MFNYNLFGGCTVNSSNYPNFPITLHSTHLYNLVFETGSVDIPTGRRGLCGVEGQAATEERISIGK